MGTPPPVETHHPIPVQPGVKFQLISLVPSKELLALRRAWEGGRGHLRSKELHVWCLGLAG